MNRDFEQFADCRQYLGECLGQTGLVLDEEACNTLVRYVGLLARWNRAYNLTSVRDPLEMVVRHILDCLVILPYIRGMRLLDLGTGAGLPGIVLAIARPDIKCVLLDGNGKKTRFCRQVTAELGLSNVEVLQLRAEEYMPATLFTTITARAFGPFSVLWNHAGRLLAPDGRLLAMKGMKKEIMKEIGNTGKSRGSIPEAALPAGNLSRPADSPGGYGWFAYPAPISGKCRIVALSVPDLDAERHLVIVEHDLTI
uniref:Ribosomal RNA small subunit methyltransferase G n=1 Tax=Candidatus Kentrum sp. FW TaxID=2126338 RepID=A0A450TNC3_9GAMM|nr:MAG: 16S rRNA (guanine527-N7)-methyltransferase [Candidatus Kentron sp. FW]VFJ69284.1 MAG: 16S rRNA (guanine527-N7)-methyltransferase [Candidatus Kentron sp. FW]